MVGSSFGLLSSALAFDFGIVVGQAEAKAITTTSVGFSYIAWLSLRHLAALGLALALASWVRLWLVDFGIGLAGFDFSSMALNLAWVSPWIRHSLSQ